MQEVDQARQQAQAHPAQSLLVYGDEKTVYRWPPPGLAYEAAGSGGAHQPTAERSSRANSKWRWAGLLDAAGGQVLVREGPVAGKDLLIGLLEDLRQAHPGWRIHLAWDNWPVHKHAEILLAASRLRIHLLYLPTYAPWTNPIEKLWGWLQKDILIMHRHSEAFDTLLERCRDFFRKFAHGSRELLHYVGLLRPD